MPAHAPTQIVYKFLTPTNHQPLPYRISKITWSESKKQFQPEKPYENKQEHPCVCAKVWQDINGFLNDSLPRTKMFSSAL
jgi:hypothetical protein